MDLLNALPDKTPRLAEPTFSVCPAGKQYRLPQPDDYASELRRLQELVAEQRSLGREIVVVMGVGFVGAIMAGVVADAIDGKTGKPGKFVLAMQCYQRSVDENRGYLEDTKKAQDVDETFRASQLLALEAAIKGDLSQVGASAFNAAVGYARANDREKALQYCDLAAKDPVFAAQAAELRKAIVK